MLKVLEEQRAELQSQMEEMLNSAKTEERAMSEDEMAKFDECETKIKAIDATIEAEKRAADLENTTEVEKVETKKELTPEEIRAEDEKIFSDFIKGETRAMAVANHSESGTQHAGTKAGDIIPLTVSNDIIKEITDKSDIYRSITVVNSTGVYKQIVEDDKITAGWTDELADVTASDATWKTLDIGHEKLGSLAKISLELLNQAEINVAAEVRTQMTDAFVDKLEDAIFNGTGTKQPTGLFAATYGTDYTLASSAAITADEVIDIFHTLKARFRSTAKWYMNNKTLLAIRKLKDSDGQYLFHSAELTTDYSGYILGKPVVVSDAINDFEIIFGDVAKAYKGNMNPNMTLQVLNEKYIDMGAKGVIGFCFFDGKPVNNQAYVKAKATA